MKMKKYVFLPVGLAALIAISTGVRADSFTTPWGEPQKIKSIMAFSEGSTDSVAIEFKYNESMLNPAKCTLIDMYILHVTDSAGNNVGRNIMSIALAAGTSGSSVQFKVHRTGCNKNRPVVSDLRIIFD
ncbi:hypothetical protein M3P05_12435 [Sansalvadorimonas sp. 2012CJ34-2]|uniref:Uncharacterized protein n=1 Tax=Parendozoicomonas callyspongiae TaxID=2942213 RepID=A0ABT0PH76_9GAMM|nr:hypothetical protein [Sansalvadorimonas sp. 2012CJ34-2]MCL6270732.1 hypothetical protein [Sansalvadorimonas sp. 2012CJ34-2]